MTTYEFQLTLTGTGETEGEAWTDAVDAFCVDPGEPNSVKSLDDDFDEVENDPSNTETWVDANPSPVFTVILLRPDYATDTFGQDTYADYVEAVDVNQAILLARQSCAEQDGRTAEPWFDVDEYCNDLHVLYVIKGKAEFIQQ